MEISRDSLLGIVRATRRAIKLAEDTRKLLIDSNVRTAASEIEGDLRDVLFKIGGETMRYNQDFLTDAATNVLLSSEQCDESITDAIMLLNFGNRHNKGTPEGEWT